MRGAAGMVSMAAVLGAAVLAANPAMADQPAAPAPTAPAGTAAEPSDPAATAPTAEPSAPAAAAPPQEEPKWIVKRVTSSADDGKHLTLSWRREHKVTPGPIIVFRRQLKAGETVQAGYGRVDLQPNELGAEFLVGNLTFRDALNPTADLPQAIPLAEAKFEAGGKFGVWTLVGIALGDGQGGGQIVDEVAWRSHNVYALVPASASEDGKITGFTDPAVQTPALTPYTSYFNVRLLGYLGLIGLATGALFVFMAIAKRRGKDMYIRRLPGIDAIEDAVGRSTEMGRPVLYVTGVDEVRDVQTLASLLILGRVAELTAEYDTELKVANYFPMTMVVAEEIVRNSYANVGRIDLHKPENVMFITAEQFAFAAGVNGIILRERPATNIYLGKFFAESLLLAETGFLTKAVQIAGTAELTQLPFFIAACDYTLIGEELFAASAYMSREPVQLAQLKAGDLQKALIIVFVIVGMIAATFFSTPFLRELFP